MAKFYVCWRTPAGERICKHIPVWMPDRRLWTPPDPRRSLAVRLPERVRGAVIALFGPRPHPWRGIDAGLSRETRRDLTLLAAMDTLTESLGPGLRASLQGSVREIAGRVPLPAGVAATLGG